MKKIILCLVCFITMGFFKFYASEISSELYGKYQFSYKEKIKEGDMILDFELDLIDKNRYKLNGYMTINNKKIVKEFFYEETGYFNKKDKKIIFEGESAREYDLEKEKWLVKKKYGMSNLKIKKDKSGKIFLNEIFVGDWIKIE